MLFGAPCLPIVLSSFLPRSVAMAAWSEAPAVAEVAGVAHAVLAAALAVEAGERAVAAAFALSADGGEGDSGGGHESKRSENEVTAGEFAK